MNISRRLLKKLLSMRFLTAVGPRCDLAAVGAGLELVGISTAWFFDLI